MLWDCALNKADYQGSGLGLAALKNKVMGSKRAVFINDQSYVHADF